ncbi:MAG: hypothetical protein WCJ30_21160 [Deltaproteobacteria bacterium]
MLWALGTPATRTTADGRAVDTARLTFSPPPLESATTESTEADAEPAPPDPPSPAA